MNYNEIKDLIKLINESDLTEFEVNLKDFNLKLKKNGDTPFVSDNTKIVYKSEEKTERIVNEVISEGANEGSFVKAPLVGTFYKSAGEGKESFVNIGDRVKKGDVLCIIEAMKIMNEIKSDVDGEIVEILVQNETIVEYDQPLFRIK